MKPLYRNCLFALLLLLSAALVFAGIGFICMYVREAVIMRSGDPDQSLLFWYLPVLFIGIFSLTGGIALLTLTKRKLKN